MPLRNLCGTFHGNKINGVLGTFTNGSSTSINAGYFVSLIDSLGTLDKGIKQSEESDDPSLVIGISINSANPGESLNVIYPEAKTFNTHSKYKKYQIYTLYHYRKYDCVNQYRDKTVFITSYSRFAKIQVQTTYYNKNFEFNTLTGNYKLTEPIRNSEDHPTIKPSLDIYGHDYSCSATRIYLYGTGNDHEFQKICEIQKADENSKYLIYEHVAELDSQNKGEFLEDVDIETDSIYPDDGVGDDGYWYVKKNNDVKHDRYIETITAVTGSLPDNGVGDDGYWYVRVTEDN